MTKVELINALRQHILDELYLDDITPEDMTDDIPLFGDEGLHMDSLDAAELVVLVEKHFGVAITSHKEALSAFTSLSVLADFILARQAGNA